MADQQDVEDCVDDVQTPGYKPPAQISVAELREKDSEDESLRKYKEALLGASGDMVFFPEDPRKVIVTKMALCPDDRDDIEIDLTGDLKKLKEEKFVVKEGTQYQMKISFHVQREICAGLKYIQHAARGPIKDKNVMMMGSYAPREEVHVFSAPKETAPSGMMYRGTYNMKSVFTDDDKKIHLEWEWKLDIKKDW